MGSVGFDGAVESQPSTSNCNKYKLPRTQLPVGYGDDASVPRKLRSAIKKRACESITSPLSISKKQCHVSNRVDTLKKDSSKKSKPKRGYVTKDEEEVAETLYALANMLSDTNKANQPRLNNEPTDTKSSAVLEAGSSMNAVEDTGIPTLREESRKISSNVTLEATCHSPNLLDSKAQFVKSQSSCGGKKPEFSSSKLRSSSPGGSGVESDLRLLPRPRVSSEQVIDLKRVTAFGAQYGDKYYPTNDKCNGLFQPPTGTQSSETQGSCLRLPAWLECTNFASRPPVIENSITTEKCTRVAVQSKLRKRSSAHVYISRLIKVLQISEKMVPEKPTQFTTSGGTHQMKGKNGKNGGVPFNGIIESAAEKDSAEIQNDGFLHKFIQDRQLATETSTLCSAKEGYDFLSLDTEVCGLDASWGLNRAGHSHEAPKQLHASYLQSQNQSGVLFSLPQNGYSSTFHGHNSALAAPQVQHPQYHSSTANGSFTARMEMQQQQKWAHQFRTQYGKTDSFSVVNYAQALFPHLHSALGSKYQQFSPPQQQLMASNSSLTLPGVKIHHNQHHFPLGIERN